MILKQPKIKQYILDNSNGICPIKKIKSELVLDHCHYKGYVRQPISRDINRLLGKIENNYVRFVNRDLTNLPTILRNIADYIEKDYSNNPIHYKHVNKIVNRYLKLDLDIQKQILNDNSLEYNNLAVRKKCFKTLILNDIIELI